MWILYLFAIADCVSHPDQLVRPFVHEYTNHVTLTARQNRRRSLEQSPIESITVDTTHLTPDDVYAVSLAYQFMTLVYNGPGISIHVQGSPSVVTTDGGYLVGTASADNVITLYTTTVPNNDALVIVVLHEMFHLFGFSNSHEEGAASFVSRVNPITLVYESPFIDACLGDKAPGTVHTDHAHWNRSNEYFKLDTMQPFISYGATATTKCTVKTVLESRPSWTDNLCDGEVCTGGKVCRSVGAHWIRVCQAPEATREGINERAIVFNVLAFLGMIGAALGGLTVCHRKRTSF